MAGIWNFTIEQGATFEQTLLWKDEDGVLMPLLGRTGRMQIRSTVTDPEVAIELTTENGRMMFSDPGQIDLTIAAIDTAGLKLSSGVHDLEIVNPAVSPVEVTRLVQGTVEISPEVTR